MPIDLQQFDPAPDGSPYRVGKLIVLEPPIGLPVTWAEAKAHLRLDTNDDQTYVETLIAAAVDYAEQVMECSLMPRLLMATFADAEPIVLPRGPLITVQSIIGRNDNYSPQYELSTAGRIVRVHPKTPLPGPISVTYRAGYTSAGVIPASIKLAILQHVATLYMNRESVSDRTKTIVPQSLADFYRLHGRGTGVR
jgi:uncharacterized phiE125 gp8 family phage protein